MLKIEKEYDDLYGEIPKDYEGRLEFLLNTMNLKRLSEPIYQYMKKIRDIKWKDISYTIYLLPKATPRPRSGKNGIFYVKGAKDNKKLFQKYLIDQEIDLIRTPCKFTCISYFPIPNSMNNIEKIAAEMGLIRPVSKPDFDNLAKAYCDMIQDLLIYDDSLVVEGVSKKFYSIKPRIEITLSYMTDFDSQFNKKKMINKKGGD
jgi:Holliday junction resolvase RusA-like endonuclease